MLVLAGMTMAMSVASASAQNPFSFLFGGFGGGQRPSPPPWARSYADPNQQPGPPGASPTEPAPRADMGGAVAYCVRLCDGRFFPIQRSAATPAEICNSFCPASRTKIFSGSSIDQAVAHDGARYADLASAFVYRSRTVEGCTCNGKDAFGLANMKASEDPTLRPGDVVATEEGFVSYSGAKKRGADFTPIESAAGLSAELRRQLSRTRIAPASPTTRSGPAVSSAAPAREGSGQRAQLDR
jgi:hypothetical protein